MIWEVWDSGKSGAHAVMHRWCGVWMEWHFSSSLFRAYHKAACVSIPVRWDSWTGEKMRMIASASASASALAPCPLHQHLPLRQMKGMRVGGKKSQEVTRSLRRRAQGGGLKQDPRVSVQGLCKCGGAHVAYESDH